MAYTADQHACTMLDPVRRSMAGPAYRSAPRPFFRADPEVQLTPAQGDAVAHKATAFWIEATLTTQARTDAIERLRALPEPVRVRLLTEATKRLAEVSFKEFVRQAWHVVEPATAFVPNWHIDAICDHLQAVSEGRVSYLLVNVPPRTSKSTIVAVMWPAWDWITRPWRQWLFASYAQKLATRDSVKCRTLIASTWYQSRWKRKFALSGDQNEKMRFSNDHTGYRIAASVGGGALGEGGHIRVLDDPQPPDGARSEIRGESTVEWYRNTWASRANDPKAAGSVIVMQRLEETDLSGFITNGPTYDLFDHLCFPMEFEAHHPTPCKSSLGFRDPRTKDGELLWPARFGADELRPIRETMGARTWAGQMQQRPAPAGGSIFLRKWFCYWRPDRPNGPTPLASVNVDDPAGARFNAGKTFNLENARRFLTVDGNLSAKDSADFTVISAWALAQGVLFLLDVQRGQFETPDVPKAIRQSIARNRAPEVWCEVDGGGLAIYQLCQREGIAVREFRARPHGDKETRANLVTPMMEQGRVVFMAGGQWLDKFEHELLTFPNGKDDQVDTLSTAGIVAFGTGQRAAALLSVGGSAPFRP